MHTTQRVLVPDESEAAELQRADGDGNVENHVGVETDQTVQNDHGVHGDDHTQGRSDHEVADLVEADQKHADDDAHQTTDADADPERLVLAVVKGARNNYASMFFKRSVAMISVGMPPAKNPQMNMLNWRFKNAQASRYFDGLFAQEAKEQADEDNDGTYDDSIVVEDVFN